MVFLSAAPYKEILKIIISMHFEDDGNIWNYPVFALSTYLIK